MNRRKYTPLYKKVMKQNEKSAMETTWNLFKTGFVYIQKTDNVYLDIEPEVKQSSFESGNDVMYDDVILTSVKPPAHVTSLKPALVTTAQRSRKKGPPPSLPNLPQTSKHQNAKNEVIINLLMHAHTSLNMRYDLD